MIRYTNASRAKTVLVTIDGVIRNICNDYHPRMQRVNAVGLSVCACVCLSCLCSNFWKPWPRNFILIRIYIFRISRSHSYIKVIRARSRLQDQKIWLNVLFWVLPLKGWTYKFHFPYAGTSLECQGQSRVSRSSSQGQGCRPTNDQRA